MSAPDPRFQAPKMSPTKNTNMHEQTDVLLTIRARGVKSHPTSSEKDSEPQRVCQLHTMYHGVKQIFFQTVVW